MKADYSPLTKTFSHYHAQVNGINLHYVMEGQGEPIVLLHGWPQTWYAWRHLIPILAQHFTVLAPDLRGLGESDKPETGYDNHTVADDIYQLIKQLELSPICLVGHDIAAPIAYACAALYPDAVQRLVVLDGTIPGLTPEKAFQFSPNQPTWQFIFHAVPNLPEQLVAGREQLYLSWFFTQKADRQDAITPDDLNEYVRQYSKPGAMKAGFEYYRSFFENATQNREHAKTKLKMPVLALGGEHSTGMLMLKMMQAVAENVQGGVVKECGHYIAEERPDYLIEQLLLFLGIHHHSIIVKG
jgi:pimeloyl-ACP methyl ester carboxylesterase